MITHPVQILHSPSTQKNDAVLLERVPFVRDVGNHLVARGKPNLGYFSNCGVRLLRGSGRDLYANPPAERASLKRRRFGLCLLEASTLANQLVYRRHGVEN